MSLTSRNNKNENNSWNVNLIVYLFVPLPLRMVVMSSLNGQLTPVLQQNTQQIMTADKMKTQQQQQQQVILQQVSTLKVIEMKINFITMNFSSDILDG